MIFGIYTRPDGAYLLVPACMQASAEAERLHGPLKFMKMMGWTERPAPHIWKTVMDELDRHSFVVLQDAAAQSLHEAEGSYGH